MNITGEEITGIILMCGLNDWKKVLTNGKGPSFFYENLCRIISEIRTRTSPTTRIFLPILPIEWGSGFPNPMKQFAIGVSSMWDVKKEEAALEFPGVFVVPKPPEYIKIKGCIGKDGLHPTALGYKV